MNEQKEIRPPKWAERLLTWYCRPELLEDLQGDLHEYFNRNIKSKSLRKAKLIYILDVLKFLRTYTIRKPKLLNLFIQWIMIGSYIKTSSRSIVRNKLFSTINIAGLAISMSVGLLMIAFLSDVLSYDQFHEKRDRIYRVISSNQSMDGDAHEFASTSVKTALLIKENIPGVESLALLRKNFGGDARVGSNIVPIDGLWANETFFDVFTFPLLKGDPTTALKEPYSLILTEKTSKKLFGDTDALGKSVRFDTVEYVVTGILKDLPRFSHIRFGSLVSFSTIELQRQKDKRFLTWESMWQNFVYVVLPENADLQSLQANLDKISAAENAKIENKKILLLLQPLNEIALGKDLSNPIGPVMTESVVWVVGGLAIIVILSACFNYTNLSIARSLRRSREVGIRKVIGALKSHVVGQFISEAVIISLMALVFSFFLFLFLRSQFLGIAPELQDIVQLDLSAPVVLYFILLAVVVGISAGFLPALFFSRINPIQILKSIPSIRVFRNVSMRKALIVVQYTFSLIFITATVIGYKQYKNFLTFNLGFTTANILNIEIRDNKADQLIKELMELREVEGISKSLMITSVGNYYGGDMKYTDPRDSADIWYNAIDENYLPLHGHKMLAGKNFSPRPANSPESEVIVNEQVLKRFNIGDRDPSKALGEVVTVDGKKLTIIGVLKDFHYGKVENQIEPVLFRYLTNLYGYVNVKVTSADWPATLARIEAAWKKIDKVHPLEATFYDDQIERAYSEFSAMLKIIGFLGFLAICIASMGLLGMVVFTTETRLKEISIRKVLGASELKLIYLLSKGFLILLSISGLIALPITYLFFDQVVLSSIAGRAPITAFDLLLGLGTVMAIACIMIGSQTLKVAQSNPAMVLKNE